MSEKRRYVVLTQTEIAKARARARRISTAHRSYGNQSPRLDLQGLYYEDEQGELGHEAVGRLLCKPPDDQVRLHGDAGYDFVVDDKTIDVKCSVRHFEKFSLFVKETDMVRHKPPTIYVNCELIGDDLVRLSGWTYGHDVVTWSREQSKIQDGKRKTFKNYYKRESELAHIDELWKLLAISVSYDDPLKGLRSKASVLPTELTPAALCGSFACGGCYPIGDGEFIHPPRAGFSQAELFAMNVKSPLPMSIDERAEIEADFARLREKLR